MRRPLLVATGCALAALGACSPSPPPQPEPTRVTRPAPPLRVEHRLGLTSEGSPLPFRWLGDTAVLIDPASTRPQLGDFGNYVARTVTKESAVRLAVWDDEAAWRAAAGGSADPATLAHKRAEYLKQGTPEAIDRYVVFDRDGKVVYQRDFRAYPLSELEG